MSPSRRSPRFLRACLLVASIACAFAISPPMAKAQTFGASNPYCPSLPASSPIDTSTGGLTLGGTLPNGILVDPLLGPNVFYISPDAATDDIHHFLNLLNQESQFSTNRYAVLFAPTEDQQQQPTNNTGSYGSCADPLVAQVGFYEQIAGLWQVPYQTVITGSLNADQILTDQNSGLGVLTTNFWRSQENLEEFAAGGPTNGVVDWGVSQGASLRKIQVAGDLWLANSQYVGSQMPCAQASGGFTADSAVQGVTNFCSQQQWYTRNSSLGTGATSYVWNFVFSDDTGTLPNASFPGGSGGDANTTILPQTPVSKEEPYLYLDADTVGNYRVFVPAAQYNSSGITWNTSGGALPSQGTSIPIGDFYIANPGSSVDDINNALASGEHLILTPGIYKYTEPIHVTNANTVVLGLGYATLVPQAGNPAISVDDVDGVSVAGLLIDAGPTNSPVLFQVGEPGVVNNRHSSNPTSLSDIFFRIGGATQGSANVSLQVDSGDAILDNIWAWRADHGNAGTYGWTTNPANTGVLVNGAAVTATGLAVEHYQQDQTIWNGEGGETVFYQSELPYDVPNQAAWQSGGSNVDPSLENETGNSANGYPSYYVGPGVCNHLAYGLGIYSFFNQGVSIVDDNAIQVPPNSGAILSNLSTVFLNGSGQISSIVNGQGAAANTGDVSTPQQLASFNGPGNCQPFDEPAGSTVEPGLVGISNPNPNSWSATNIMNAFETYHSDDTIVMSHRGLHALVDGSNPGVPENSLQSIGLAAEKGIEAVEVDIKLTQDGTPILSHDYTWGRETCGHWFSVARFDPFIAAGDSTNDGANPKVGDVALSRTRYWILDTTTLRDTVTLANNRSGFEGCTPYFSAFGEYPPTLQDTLDYMTKNSIPTVLVLDIKDQTTAAAAWKVVAGSQPDFQQHPYWDRVLFKIAARNFQGAADIQNTFSQSPGSTYARLYPYFGTADIQPTPKGFGSEAAINDWITAAEGNPNDNIYAIEVNQKQADGDHLLSTTVQTAAQRYLVGSFSPYTEYLDPNNPGVPEFFSNMGYCAPCEQLSTYFYPGPGGADTDDQRGNFSFLQQIGFKIITADNALDIINDLAGAGQRNTSYYNQ